MLHYMLYYMLQNLGCIWYLNAQFSAFGPAEAGPGEDQTSSRQ